MITRLQAVLSKSNGELQNESDPMLSETNNCMTNNMPNKDTQSECKKTFTIQTCHQRNQLTDNILSQHSITNLPEENKQSEVETNNTVQTCQPTNQLIDNILPQQAINNLKCRASSSQEMEQKKEWKIKACLKSIKKPSRNPYINFIQAHKNQFKEKGANGRKLMLRMSAKWNSLSDEQKKPYRDMAKQVPYTKVTYKKKPKKRKPAKSRSYSTGVSDSTYYSTQSTNVTESRANSTTSSYTTTKSYGSRTSN